MFGTIRENSWFAGKISLLDSGGLEVCANAWKHVFNHPRREKIIFEGLDSGGQEMHQNTFLTTPEVKKIIF